MIGVTERNLSCTCGPGLAPLAIPLCASCNSSIPNETCSPGRSHVLVVLLQLKNVMAGAAKTPASPTTPPAALPASPAIKAGVYRAPPFTGSPTTPAPVRVR